MEVGYKRGNHDDEEMKIQSDRLALSSSSFSFGVFFGWKHDACVCVCVCACACDWICLTYVSAT